MDTKFVSFIRSTLRRASFRWAPRGVAEKKARVPHGFYKNGKQKYGYQCAECKKVFQKKDTCVDHIVPVIGPEGFTTFDEMIKRMFCEADNLQILCNIPDGCHKKKTKAETTARAEVRRRNK